VQVGGRRPGRAGALLSGSTPGRSKAPSRARRAEVRGTTSLLGLGIAKVGRDKPRVGDSSAGRAGLARLGSVGSFPAERDWLTREHRIVLVATAGRMLQQGS